MNFGIEEPSNMFIFSVYLPPPPLQSIPGHRLQEDRAVAGVLVPLLRALANLHEQGICHRDIKLENILVGGRNDAVA